MNKTNYRPIIILSAIYKLLEKVKYDQLYGAFSPIFSTNMSGVPSRSLLLLGPNQNDRRLAPSSGSKKYRWNRGN